MSARILIIEDDDATVNLIEEAVKEQYFSIDVSRDGKSGLERAVSAEYDLVILDLNLPSMNGFDICRSLREKRPQQMLLMLTGRSSSVDKVVGLELGADDYVVKPFSPAELVARVRALLRRRHRASEGSLCLHFKNLQIDAEKRQVLVRGDDVKFTAIEFDILFYLASHAGRVITRDELRDAVWDFRASEFDATITSHLSRVRAKIETNPAKPVYIKTMYGVGYKFSAAAELESSE